MRSVRTVSVPIPVGFWTVSDKISNRRQILGGQAATDFATASNGCLLSNEVPMFKFVGWVAISGFAVYGFTKFVRNHVVLEKTPEA